MYDAGIVIGYTRTISSIDHSIPTHAIMQNSNLVHKSIFHSLSTYNKDIK